MEKIDKEIEDLKEKLKLAKERKQKIEVAKKAEAARKKRKEENRKKVLVGAMYMWMMEKDKTGEAAKITIEGLNAFLTRPDERELFGLPVLNQQEQKDEKAAQS